MRSRAARGRPNWWVILAVSLGLMALLVATAGTGTRAPTPRREAVDARVASRPGARQGAGAKTHPVPATTSTTTSTTSLPPAGATDVASSVPPTVTPDTPAAAPAAPSVTTTTAAPVATTTTTTTTAATSGAVAADRTQTQGYLDPPLQPSNQFGFTGAGAMEVSVVWSGATYLTMEVSCPSGDQSVGGTSAMAASLPDASGHCLATVSEPTSEAASLTYTITIGPAGG